MAIYVELFFITENLPSTPIMSFNLTAASKCWGIDPVRTTPPILGDFYFTNEYNNVNYNPSANNLGGHSGGYNFITSPDQYNYPIFAYGLYKVTNNVNDKYFFVDYRDTRAGFYRYFEPPTVGQEIDVWIKYNETNGYFEYSTHPSYYGYTSISNGQLLRIWEIKGKGKPQTELFPNFWSNALAVINSSSGNPRLVWGPHPTMEATQYKIYRAISALPLSNPEGSMSLIASVGDNCFDYIDTDVVLHSGGNYVYYYVKAYNGSVYSNRTNIVNVNAYIYKETISKDNKQLFDFRLYQNYPNPFNPSTKIKISVPSYGVGDRTQGQQVKLVVYDIMGRKIKTLINKLLQPGEYEIELDASNLPSGVYFYTLYTGSSVITKKMTLIR